MRRIPALLLIAAFILGACSPNSGLIAPAQPTSSPTPPPPLPTPLVYTPTPAPTPLPDVGSPDKLRGVEIQIWHGWDGSSASLFDQMASEFSLSNKWGIKVSVVRQQNLSLLSDAVDKALTTTEHPDIVVALPEQILAWKEQVVDLTPYTVQPDFGLNPQDLMANFGDQSNLKGVRYGIPAARTARFLFYNSSFAHDLGFSSAPHTPDEFRKQACTANAFWKKDKDLTNDGYGGLALDVTSNWQTPYSWLATNGGNAFSDGQVQFNTPDNVNALNFVSLLRADNCAWLPDSETNYEFLANRRALFITGSLSDIAAQNVAFSAASSPDQWTVLPFPGKDTGIVMYGPDYAVLKSNNTRQLASWLFIRWLMEPKNQVRWALGTGLLPVTNAALDGLKKNSSVTSQWSAALGLIPLAKGYPQTAAWKQADKILADGFIAYFRSYPSQTLAAVLGQIDGITQDLLKK